MARADMGRDRTRKALRMNTESALSVRRAKLSDVESMAAFLQAASRSTGETAPYVTPENIVARFGQVGFLLALEGEAIVGLAGWQIENLVVRVTDLVVRADAGMEAVAQKLVDAMEREARALMAEVILLFLPHRPSPKLVAFFRALGYELVARTDLRPLWRDAVEEFGANVEQVMFKPL